MFRAIWNCVKRVAATYEGAGGIFSAVFGSLAEFFGARPGLPGWAWLALGALLLFFTACRIEWELLKEKETGKKAEPNMRLEEAVKRIRGKEDIFGPDNSESASVLEALETLREKLLHEHIEAFGCRHEEWRAAHSDLRGMLVRHKIAAHHWEDHNLDYLTFTEDRAGLVVPIHKPLGEATHYQIWFDADQIDRVWPAPRKKWTLGRGTADRSFGAGSSGRAMEFR